MLSSEMNDHSVHFKELEERHSNLLAKNTVHELDIKRETTNRYEKLRTSLAKLWDSINEDLQKWDEFQSLHAYLVLKLSELDALLAQLQIKGAVKAEKSPSITAYEEKFEKLLVRFHNNYHI